MDPTRALIVIDVQKGFITDDTALIPGAVQALQADYGHVIATRFLNPSVSQHRKLIGWERFTPGTEEVELAFSPPEDAWVYDKTTYTAVTPALLERLDQWGINTVDLCGIATDGCVLKTAVDLFEAGLRPRVLSQYCASHGGPDCHQAGLTLLRRFIGERQVV